jgi:hypothetical protein
MLIETTMMWKTMANLAIGASLAAAGFARNSAAETLQSGSYDVIVSVELPNVLDTAARKVAKICVTEDGTNAYGLAVLGDNNPLAQCPAVNIRQDRNTLSFDIVCQGANSARASATYVFSPHSFEGHIAMKMGGKNMTMTETQRGHRVGNCTPASPRS